MYTVTGGARLALVGEVTFESPVPCRPEKSSLSIILEYLEALLAYGNILVLF